MTRWKFTIEYNGTDYFGWQRQNDGPSIQQAIEEAIEGFCQQQVTLTVAGRTDAGVHARGQIAHVDLKDFSRPMEPFEVAKAINAHLLPQPISIIKAEIVDDEFNARFSAKNKLYTYRIINRQAFLALEKGFAWHVKRPLEINSMREGAKYLIGKHDFTSFRDSDCQAKSPEKTVDMIELTSLPYDVGGGQDIRIEVEGRSFLHHMVRNIAGTLKLVGEGKWQPQDVKKALDAKDRKQGGPTAPACGLFLTRIDYD